MKAKLTKLLTLPIVSKFQNSSKNEAHAVHAVTASVVVGWQSARLIPPC